MSDKVHFAFSSAFTLPPDQGENSEGELVLDDAWYHPRTHEKDYEVSIPTFILCKKSNEASIDFELGMNLVYRYGKGGNEAVVYEGESAYGLVHKIRWKYGSKRMVHDSNLRLLDQPELSNLPSMPLDYRNEVTKCLYYDEAQALTRPISLSPLQQ